MSGAAPEPHGSGALQRWPGHSREPADGRPQPRGRRSAAPRGFFSWRGWRWLLPVIVGLLSLAFVAMVCVAFVIAYEAYVIFIQSWGA
jgi:hypothetical protein